MNLIEANIQSSGGICDWKIDVIKANEVGVWPKHHRLRFIGGIELVENAEWVSIPFVRETPEPKERSISKGGSKYYQFKLSAPINEPNSERLTKILDYEDEPLIIKYTDLKGVTRVIGSPKHPASLVVSGRNGGKGPGNRHDADLILFNTSKSPSIEL